MNNQELKTITRSLFDAFCVDVDGQIIGIDGTDTTIILSDATQGAIRLLSERTGIAIPSRDGE